MDMIDLGSGFVPSSHSWGHPPMKNPFSLPVDGPTKTVTLTPMVEPPTSTFCTTVASGESSHTLARLFEGTPALGVSKGNLKENHKFLGGPRKKTVQVDPDCR